MRSYVIGRLRPATGRVALSNDRIEIQLGPLPPHSLIADFLAPDEHQALLSWAVTNVDQFVPSLVGDMARHDPARRVSRSLRLTSEVQPWREILKTRLSERLPQIFAGAGLKQFEVEKFELELVCYYDGAYFKVHKDISTVGTPKKHDRILTGVYYFFTEPKRFSGGEIRLFPFGFKEGDVSNFVEIEPRQNTLLVFPSWAMHEVTRVNCPDDDPRSARFAINCWLHKRRRD